MPLTTRKKKRVSRDLKNYHIYHHYLNHVVINHSLFQYNVYYVLAQQNDSYLRVKSVYFRVPGY